jgi:hypothetical protein
MNGILVTLLCYRALGAAIVEYKLGINCCQIFNDFSNNDRDGTNGNSPKDTIYDTNPTYRGAFFGDNSFIILPPSDGNSGFLLPSTFTINIWVFCQDKQNTGEDEFKNAYYIFRRSDDSSDNFINIIRNNSDLVIQISINRNKLSSSTSDSSFKSSKI